MSRIRQSPEGRTFKVDAGTILAADLPINGTILAVGLLRGLISFPVAKYLADHARLSSTEEDFLVETLRDNEEEDALEICSRQIDAERIDYSTDPAGRFWVWLVSSTIWSQRHGFSNPLELMEEVYSFFGYPVSLSALIRYMPPPPGEASGVAALVARWGRYVADERMCLERVLSQGSCP
ncbi:DUF2247 family protein [Microbacterium sp. KSW2-29]|uniref:DUF2247 family protein n=1 Tax=Microbacterium phycohabitans TaxID=3075993 RepID=A0ABU3SM22_9MICO|nr:DUF2247 family protein [Microbacterium sp. KSW2-29]MDU0345432.1 DUF2247 family protein [Microbacterium sp. KSW2-29]